MRNLLLVSALLVAGCSAGSEQGSTTSTSSPASIAQNQGSQPQVQSASASSQGLGAGSVPPANYTDARMRSAEQPDVGAEPRFDHAPANQWKTPASAPLSTFSIDVDTASYALVRGMLGRGEKPSADAVRVEEMVNYFPYEYSEPARNQPFALDLEVANCPWNADAELLRIGLQAKREPKDQLPPRNLVFLLDVSGSMNAPDRLGLVQSALTRLTEGLTKKDHVAIVAYAGNPGIMLPPTSGDQKQKITDVLDQLAAGGSTNGAGGIEEAYALAARHFDPKGVNRVILATDGDFNVGPSSNEELIDLIEKKRKSGVFLTTLGVGQENINDHMLEQLADHGNGNYAFLDSDEEARKVLVKEAASTLVTLARDVKIQVEFNPKTVKRYRLVGYENRLLKAQDFNDDTKDAGEVGSGHQVTALYELQLADSETRPAVAPLHFQKGAASGEELGLVNLRYQPAQGGKSKLMQASVTRDQCVELKQASDDFRFAAAVGQFGLLLRGTPKSGSWNEVKQLANESRGQDVDGYRSQFVQLVEKAQELCPVADAGL